MTSLATGATLNTAEALWIHICARDILTLLGDSEVSFSPRGVIRLGPFITVQRKGGDGSRVPKTD